MTEQDPGRKTRVAVLGATGYSGAELCVLLARHSRAETVSVFSSGNRDARPVPFARLHPLLGGAAGPDAEPFSNERLEASRPDVVFLATPNETSAEVAPKILASGAKVIDISGAFRLREPADYPKWYGFEHPAPALLSEAVYGLTEWRGEELRGARLVANPGCYATSVLLALKPVLGLLAPGEPVVCDSVSGVSGAGKKSDLAYSFSELDGNFKAYGVGVHRHEPEMRQDLGLSPEAPFVFVPHLLPTVRGILSTLHVAFARPQTPEALTAAFARAYLATPFVRVRPAGELPELRDVVGTPRAEIGFALLHGGRRAVIVSVIDNLLKGAASQAVQNMNRVFGHPETEGLS
ncbi:MAG: N-acetyl-gamma-glutamyl-phosphate reductase [Thermoanaerobaculia bacterium]|nr:N-acetyl-gamma-glutamyl-phosphate reductase [Thermoanaerobaculia bacterium]